MEKGAVALLLIGTAAGCSVGAPATLTLNSASVDTSYTCPPGSVDAPYSLHGVIGVHNGTSTTVTIRSVAAVMTLAAVKGPWLEKVGDRYEAAGVTSSLNSLGAGSSGAIQVVVPSTCTVGKAPGTESSYGDYSLGFTVTTSSGTYRIESANRHRLIAG